MLDESLDIDPQTAKTPQIDANLIANVIRIVGAAMGEEKLPVPSPAKHAELIARRNAA